MLKRNIMICFALVIFSLFSLITNINAQEVKIDKQSRKNIIHNFNNETEIKKFTLLSNEMFEQISNSNIDKPFIATTTLKRALLMDEFIVFANKYKLDVNDYKIRAIKDDGTRITIFVKSSDNLIIDQEELNYHVDGGTFIGVIAFTCNVTQTNFDEIKNMKQDDNVYLVDVDSYFIQKNIERQGQKNDKAIRVNDIYWYLEKYNLTNPN